MLQEETGPWAVFERLRAVIYSYDFKPGGLVDMFMCFYCLSIWTGFLVSLFFVHENFFSYIALAVALSTISVFINIAHDIATKKI